MDNKSLLKEIHKSNIASMSWQHASLRSIQRKLGVCNLWDSIFVFQPKQESLESESNRLWAFDVSEAEDISVHVGTRKCCYAYTCSSSSSIL